MEISEKRTKIIIYIIIVFYALGGIGAFIGNDLFFGFNYLLISICLFIRNKWARVMLLMIFFLNIISVSLALPFLGANGIFNLGVSFYLKVIIDICILFYLFKNQEVNNYFQKRS